MTETEDALVLPKSIEKKMWNKVNIVLSNWNKFEENRAVVFEDKSAVTMDEDNMYYYQPLINNMVMRVTLPTDGSDTYSDVRVSNYVVN